MDFKQYQKAALETALPTARNLDYLIPGLIAEIGECFGKVAKARRDEWDEGRLNDELVKEWGDCAWMTAVALHVAGGDVVPDFEVTPSTRKGAMTEALRFAMMAGAGRAMPAPLVDLWPILADSSEIVTGQPFDVVLEANLAKLKDRQARNVIGGSGDLR